MTAREHFSSRLGFVLIAAGCAIGLGNIWRFPYIAGQYGGALFVVMYVVFLLAVGVPILSMELAVGRASRLSAARAFDCLRPGPHPGWRCGSYLMMCGNYLLMSFYCVVTGWMLDYCLRSFGGEFTQPHDARQAGAAFTRLLAAPGEMLAVTAAVVVLGFAVCALGLRRGVERVTKPMMIILLLLLVLLAVHSAFLPGFSQGLAYYLRPSLGFLQEHGWHGLVEILSAALAQAFFTLSIGIGCIQIFGTYMSRDRTLLAESLTILLLDTAVALLAGLIIFPACFSFGVEPDQGPQLIFVTLVSIFSSMSAGWLWGGLFFTFMFFAAMSTTIAVFENIIAMGMELLGISRRRSVMLNTVLMLLLCLPCILGFNVLADFHPLGGSSTILDLEDFLISGNILPLGALCYVAFTVWRGGWGLESFLAEVNAGRGPRLPRRARCYLQVMLPLLIAALFVGYLL